MPLKKTAILAFFTTLSLIIFTLESMIPPLIPIPGIKLGLANIITLILLQNVTVKDTLWVLLSRILLSSFFFSQAVGLIYSLVGGLFGLVVMAVCNRFLHKKYCFITGISGGISHNIGQIIIAYLLTMVPGVLIYLPFLILSGTLTGFFTGLCAYFVQKYLQPILKRIS